MISSKLYIVCKVFATLRSTESLAILNILLFMYKWNGMDSYFLMLFLKM